MALWKWFLRKNFNFYEKIKREVRNDFKYIIKILNFFMEMVYPEENSLLTQKLTQKRY